MFDHNFSKKHTFVQSDIHKLSKVIIHPIGNERNHIVPKFGYLNQPGFSVDILGEAAKAQHRSFVQTLHDLGLDVLNTYDLINSALSNLHKSGELNSWIQQNFPDLISLIDSDKKLDALDLIGAEDSVYYNFNADRELHPLAKPLASMYYTRDLAVTLPEGVLITTLGTKRSAENKIAKLMFKYSDPLKHIPIIFDASEEDVLVQGGDLIVLDENTIIMGIDNVSERKAAQKIAQKLNKFVIGVVLPTSNVASVSPFSSLFLHLDTVFNLIDKNKALVVPHFFESKYIHTNPIYSILGGVRASLSKEMQFDLSKVMNNLKDVGNVVTFDAGSGLQSDMNMKLVDYMKSRFGFEFVYVGGDIPESFEMQVKHMIETVLPETRFQAGNVVAIKPGQVMMYMDNTSKTHEALHNAGINTIPVDGSELARWNGGPHCMTLPILRA